MDEYGQTGPERDSYDEDVRGIAEALGKGRAVYVRFAQRSTSYPLLIVQAVNLETGGAPLDGAGLQAPIEHWFYVAREGDGAYWFNLHPRFSTVATPWYVREKLNLPAEGDGECVAGFLQKLGETVFGAVSST